MAVVQRRVTPPMPVYKKHNNSDESRVITIVVGTLLACLALAYLLNKYLQTRETREIQDAQAQVYERYLHNTRRPSAPAAAPEAMTEQQKISAQLLAHPAVTPGPGFSAPGVQSTGKAIIDALDETQGRTASN